MKNFCSFWIPMMAVIAFGLALVIGVKSRSVTIDYNNVKDVETTIYEVTKRDNLWDVVCEIPETADPDCGDFIYAGFLTDDPWFAETYRIERFWDDNEKIPVTLTVNYNGEWEILAVNGWSSIVKGQ